MLRNICCSGRVVSVGWQHGGDKVEQLMRHCDSQAQKQVRTVRSDLLGAHAVRVVTRFGRSFMLTLLP
jgi:hypothetical protein